MKKDKLSSIFTNLISFGIQIFISLFITPIIVNRVGIDAYGYIGLANDFIIYISIITTVLNSVSGRFIAVAMCNNDVKKVRQYFTSVFMMNLLLVFFILIFAAILLPNLQYFIEIPENLVWDVKLTFLFTILAYVVNIMISIYTTATFVKNRLDIQGIRNTLQYIIRGTFIVLLFNLLPPRIYLVGLITLISGCIIALFDFIVFKKLMPEVIIRIKYFRWGLLKELAASGGLLAITNLSSILLMGLDLLIANLALGSYPMGVLSTAKTIPGNISSAVIIVASLFTPTFIELYAKKRKKDLVQDINESMKIITAVLFVPIIGFMCFSPDFYSLWLPGKTSEEISTIAMLSNIVVIESLFNAVSFPLAQISLVTNKMKLPVAVSLGIGVVSTTTVFLLLNVSNLGVYAIAGTSSILLILRYLIFNPWYAAKVLEVKKSTFFKTSYQMYLTIPIVYGFMQIMRRFFKINSWRTFLVTIIICGAISYVLMLLILYGKKIWLKRKNKK